MLNIQLDHKEILVIVEKPLNLKTALSTGHQFIIHFFSSMYNTCMYLIYYVKVATGLVTDCFTIITVC